jgi:hypothetical protein
MDRTEQMQLERKIIATIIDLLEDQMGCKIIAKTKEKAEDQPA